MARIREGSGHPTLGCRGISHSHRSERSRGARAIFDSPSSGTQYNLPNLAAGGPIPAAGGTFTVDNGVAGGNISHFSTTITIPSAFTLTSYTADLKDSVNEPSITWSGGGGADTFVEIIGSSDSGGSIFFCAAPADAGQFQIPAFVLQGLLSGSGTLSVGMNTKSRLFSAPGLDLGIAGGGTVIQVINVSFN